MITIKHAAAAIERELLSSPLGFKGAYLTEVWQTIIRLESAGGASSIGLGVQSILWSDPGVFAKFSELHGNTIMHQLTRHALQLAKETPFDSPLDLMDRLIPAAYDYGKKRLDDGLKPAFVLNALAAIDHAAWLLYGEERKLPSFGELLPEAVRPALASRHHALASMPLVSYGMTEAAIEELLEQGFFVLKIKLGYDPNQDGDPAKMLDWDKRRLSVVHRLARERECAYTRNGRVAYVLDANGRYDGRERLLRLFEHADRIGALDRILLFEEPFAPECYEAVGDMPVRMAADESVHDECDALERMDLGYSAIALQPAAKTMSVCLRIASAARERGAACYGSDLTANPFMAEWSKNLAARLAPLPGMSIGLLESNGEQNYVRWEKMLSYHPCSGATWTDNANGLFLLDETFYAKSGGIFERSEHYAKAAGR
ncbi:hypothetical protein [Paenibacillus sp. MBLB4367]|uniref:hypothetical protein n=1 Tax=Paenibacillus sp. MBLB4367 TaxID=3384767 RepID=UPI0039083016